MKNLTEKRSGLDRRQREQGPPGPIERRRRIEQRQMEIVELTISENEWLQLFPPPRPPPAPSDDRTAQVFELASRR